MYSLLLMTAMTGSADASAFGWRSGGCTGASVGCYGSCYGSGYGSACYGTGCVGSCYGSCYGSSCYGSSCHGGRVGLFGRLFGRMRSGCTGSCYGSACYGSSCYGTGCTGSCYGSSCHGNWYTGASCMGSCYGSFYGLGAYGSCYGAPAGWGTVVGAQPAIDPIPYVRYLSAEESAAEKAAAKLTVELPATAKLFVDGGLTAGTGASRQFHTPELAKGQSYFYDLKAEVEVNGVTKSESQRVIVKAGETASVSFKTLLAAVPGTGASLAAK